MHGCYYCAQGSGCTTIGVCGKTPEVAALQDLLLYRLKGLAGVASHAREASGITDDAADEFFNAAMFSTLTNVNFDAHRFVEYIQTTNRHISAIKAKLAEAGSPSLPVPEVRSRPTENSGHPLLGWLTAYIIVIEPNS